MNLFNTDIGILIEFINGIESFSPNILMLRSQMSFQVKLNRLNKHNGERIQLETTC